MTIKKPLARAIRIAISGAAGLSAALTSTAVLSQDELQEVVITGSRIRQNPLEQRLPVLSVTEDEFRASGATSIADFVQRLPITGSAINRTNNASGNLGFPSDGGGIGAGASEVDLRYLTSKRVLVLVDGRRWIKGSSGSGVSGAVDLNSIPANAVKSIEILQDGASAIYGSDAIGGVVNIITQDDYDSFRITGYTGQYRQGDGETSEFDVRMGARSDGGVIDEADLAPALALHHAHQVRVVHRRQRVVAHAAVAEQQVADEQVALEDGAPVLRKRRAHRRKVRLEGLQQRLGHRPDVAAVGRVEGGADLEVDLLRARALQPAQRRQRLRHRGLGLDRARLQRRPGERPRRQCGLLPVHGLQQRSYFFSGRPAGTQLTLRDGATEEIVWLQEQLDRSSARPRGFCGRHLAGTVPSFLSAPRHLG